MQHVVCCVVPRDSWTIKVDSLNHIYFSLILLAESLTYEFLWQATQTPGASEEERMFHMKRQWFFVAEVADKFAFLIYLVTMSFTIFMILYIIPVHMRRDPVMT